MSRAAHIAGGLLGLAVADAEAAGRLLGFEPHQVTHHTQLTRELLDSLCQHRGLKPLDVAARLAHLSAAGRLVAAPSALVAASQRLEARVPFAEAGAPPPASTGDGVVRSCAVGWFYACAPEGLVEVTQLQTQATHLDARCAVAAVLMAEVVAGLVRGEGSDAHALMKGVSARVASLDAALASQVAGLAHAAQSPGDDGHRLLLAGVDADDGARVATLWALHCWLAHRDDLSAALVAARQCPETSGAVLPLTGALFGTDRGEEALKAASARVHDRGRWQAADLVALAERAA